MSQEELAHRSGVSVRTVRYLETGRVRRPRAGSVRLLAEALALSGAEREQFVRAAAHGAPEASPAAGSESTGGSGEPLEPGGHPPQRDPVPRQVPAAVPDFVGRAEELAALDRAAGTDAGPRSGVGSAAVVGVVSGTAGVGKTALVARWAHARAPHFPDGSLFVDLRGFSTEEPLPAADALALLLRGVGVAAADVPVDVDERAASYRTRLAGRRLLVVLDNAGSVEQVRPLLPGAAGPVVVVTSRDPLAGLVARDGARRVDLDLLSSEDAGALLTTLIGARAVADPAAAAHLAEQCARLPLALRVAAELAVGRAGTTLSRLVVDLADEERRLDLLDAGGDSRTAVEAVLSWSYRALPDRAARAFRAVGLHPGPHVDVAAVAALLDVDVRAAEDAIHDLCRAHLMAEVAPSRYWLHDLLHATATRIGRDTDRTEVRDAARARLFAHYTATAAQAADLAFPPRQWAFPPPPPPASSPALPGRAEALAWLDAERPVLAHPGLRPPPAMSIGLSETLSRYLYDGSPPSTRSPSTNAPATPHG